MKTIITVLIPIYLVLNKEVYNDNNREEYKYKVVSLNGGNVADTGFIYSSIEYNVNDTIYFR